MRIEGAADDRAGSGEPAHTGRMDDQARQGVAHGFQEARPSHRRFAKPPRGSGARHVAEYLRRRRLGLAARALNRRDQ